MGKDKEREDYASEERGVLQDSHGPNDMLPDSLKVKQDHPWSNDQKDRKG